MVLATSTGCVTRTITVPGDPVEVVRTEYVVQECPRITLPVLTATRPPDIEGLAMDPKHASDLLQNMMLLQEDVLNWIEYSEQLETYIAGVTKIVNEAP